MMLDPAAPQSATVADRAEPAAQPLAAPPQFMSEPPAFVAQPAPKPIRRSTMSEAEKLRRLDIMLMVTSLRCRTGAENFQAEFQQFESRHLPELNAAAHSLRDQMVSQLGQQGADRAIDRLSVVIANTFGSGHPTLGCHELHELTQRLALVPGPEPLVAAADEVFNGDAPLLAIAR
ncbi:MAG TPA: S-adenosyl-L-homocysteine hydrolase [Novosphingobium sp.]|nr:S-adenosyl-L-homocysteine hydrolase [Novosphingobium sp.]